MGTAHAGTAGNPAPVMALAPLERIEAHGDVYLPNGLADRRHCAAQRGAHAAGRALASRDSEIVAGAL